MTLRSGVPSLMLMISLLAMSISCIPSAHVFFSPRDNVTQRLIEYIQQATHSVKGAVATITNKSVTRALINAHKKGLRIELIVDHGWIAHSRLASECIHLLQENGISVFLYQGKQHKKKGRYSLMHNKFLIFDHHSVWTGSFNITHQAHQANYENSIIVHDHIIAHHYAKEFEHIKHRSTQQRSRNKSQTVTSHVKRRRPAPKKKRHSGRYFSSRRHMPSLSGV